MFVLRKPRELEDRELRLARIKITGAGGKVLKSIAGSFLVEGPPHLAHALAKVLPRWRCMASIRSTRLPEHSLRPYMRRRADG
ncbi:hypothetical protein ACVNIS_11310 [Sphaerotilaceae bacterium SBD11-9]